MLNAHALLAIAGPMWPLGAVGLVLAVLGAVTAPARHRADLRTKARRRVEWETALSDARREARTARKGA